MKKSDFTGWKEVFAFTFIQNFKSKAAVIGLVLICLVIIAAGPVLSLGAAEGATSVLNTITETSIEKVYVINNTDFSFSTEKFRQTYPHYSDVIFEEYSGTAADLAAGAEGNTQDDMIAEFSYDEENNSYNILLSKFKGSSLSLTDTETFSSCLDDSFRSDRLYASGLDDDMMEKLNVSISSESVTAGESEKGGNESDINPALVMVIMVYAISIMMLVVVSSQQIAASLVIEKSSKVIETIMVSVRPLALILGKITGTLAVLICNFAAVFVSAFISMVLTAVLTAKKMAETFSDMTQKMAEIGEFPTVDQASAAGAEFFEISPGRILAGIFIIIITTVLAFIFYAVVAGITGASCSSVEELQNANAFTVFSMLAGLYIAMFAPLINNDVLTKIATVFPFSGALMIPVYFIFGKAGAGGVLIVWAELIVLTVLLAKFAAGIYQMMIFHKGERLKLKNLIALSKNRKGGVR